MMGLKFTHNLVDGLHNGFEIHTELGGSQNATDIAEKQRNDDDNLANIECISKMHFVQFIVHFGTGNWSKTFSMFQLFSDVLEFRLRCERILFYPCSGQHTISHYWFNMTKLRLGFDRLVSLFSNASNYSLSCSM